VYVPVAPVVVRLDVALGFGDGFFDARADVEADPEPLGVGAGVRVGVGVGVSDGVASAELGPTAPAWAGPAEPVEHPVAASSTASPAAQAPTAARVLTGAAFVGRGVGPGP